MLVFNNGNLDNTYMQNTLSFQSKNIRSFQPHEAQAQHDRTAIRYHYTSASALMTILKTQNNDYGFVRFTDARYMNDRSEHMFFIKRLLEFMEKHRNDYPHCQEVINELLLKKHTIEEYTSLSISGIEETESELISYRNSRHFLFCMCKESDSLHMWNYYIRNGNYQGYNIGIKIYDFLKSFDHESDEKYDQIRFYCGDVLYKQNKQEEEIDVLCKSIEDICHDQYNSVDKHLLIQIAMAYLWAYIECCGLFYKDESFSDEKEYRIVIQYDVPVAGITLSSFLGANNSRIEYSYFERNGIIVPCLMVPLATDAVKQITMSPMLESQIASASIHDYLETNGYAGVSVRQSSIPIRY